MTLQRITDAQHPMLAAAMKLYQISFPPHEQRKETSQREILSDADYHFDLIYEDELFVGLVLYWETADFVYIEHFCIQPELRGKQYGQKTLNLLQEKQKTLILEIDPPVDDISKRRKQFYLRCGFAENPYPHVHPPYHPENHGHTLVLLSCPHEITPEQNRAFQRYLSQRVMHKVF